MYGGNQNNYGGNQGGYGGNQGGYGGGNQGSYGGGYNNNQYGGQNNIYNKPVYGNQGGFGTNQQSSIQHQQTFNPQPALQPQPISNRPVVVSQGGCCNLI